MILIADSGSTKTHWCVIEKSTIIKEVFTSGINPYYQSEEEIHNLIEAQLIPEINNYSIKNLFFYGAGCALPEKKVLLSNIIGSYINSSIISVESDLLAAARALFNKEKGIACILGTGSNSCLYDGKEIIENVPSLGFILGDEGSGAVLGKLLVSAIFKNQLPTDLKNKFLEKYELTVAIVQENVYKKPFPNRYLAKLSIFLLENIEHPVIRRIVYEEFNRFIQRNVMQYAYKENRTGFIGSIAYYFADILKEVCYKNNVEVIDIIQQPMKGLIKYHSL